MGDLKTIGTALGVSTLLDGSVRKSGQRLRITVELVDAADGFQIWSETYDRELQDVFQIQGEIARTVAQALEISLSAQESGALGQQTTRDAVAYDLYLRGRKRYYEYNRRAMESARELFARAIERDRSFAQAHAGLADCHSYLFRYAGLRPADLKAAETSANKALDLDPDCAEAHASLGAALSFAGRHREAEQAFETAIRLDPQLFEAHYFYARDCGFRRQLDKSAFHYEQAMKLWPDDYQAPLVVSQIYQDLGRLAEADSARRRGLALAEQRLSVSPDDVRALYLAANALVTMGERERGLELAERALALDPDEPTLLFNMACIHSLAGNRDVAVSSLERALDAGLSVGEWLEHDSQLDAIRGHPRFPAILERVRSP